MALFNTTGFDLELFIALNSVLHIMIFFIIALPSLILCGICVVALLASKSLHRKMRVILANIYVSEIIFSTGSIFLYLLYPIRSSYNEGDITCSIDAIFLGVGTLSSLATVSLYAIATYVFVKYGPKKLNLRVVYAYITISWVVNILVVISLLVTRSVEVNSEGLQRNTDGFCGFDFMDASTVLTTIYLLAAGIIALWVFVTLILISVFGLLTLCYVKKNTIKENKAIKKAIAKNLLYLTTKVFATIITAIFFFGFSSLRFIFEEHISVIVYIVFQYLFGYIAFGCITLITPIASLVILQPLQVAIKRICCCSLKNEHSVQASRTVSSFA